MMTLKSCLVLLNMMLVLLVNFGWSGEEVKNQGKLLLHLWLVLCVFVFVFLS